MCNHVPQGWELARSNMVFQWNMQITRVNNQAPQWPTHTIYRVFHWKSERYLGMKHHFCIRNIRQNCVKFLPNLEPDSMATDFTEMMTEPGINETCSLPSPRSAIGTPPCGTFTQRQGVPSNKRRWVAVVPLCKALLHWVPLSPGVSLGRK